MARLLGLLVTLGVAAGSLESGKQVLDMLVRLFQVTVERFTLGQIGRALMAEHLVRGRKLTPPELPVFIRQNITAGGRDPSRDLWGTAYHLETRGWRQMAFRPGGDEFAVCSAGPNRAWWNSDDLYWMNFIDPSPAPGDPSLPHGDEVLKALEKKAQATREWASRALESLRRGGGGGAEGAAAPSGRLRDP
jgi:hypothetical protein